MSLLRRAPLEASARQTWGALPHYQSKYRKPWRTQYGKLQETCYRLVFFPYVLQGSHTFPKKKNRSDGGFSIGMLLPKIPGPGPEIFSWE